MDIFGDHALLCRQDPPPLDSSYATVLFSRLLARSCARQVSFTWMSRSTCIGHEMRDLSRVVVRGLLGPHSPTYMVGIVITSAMWILLGSLQPGGCWRDATSALATIKQAKRDKHTQTCASNRYFLPFGFSVFDWFTPAAQELLDRIYCRYRFHARITKWEAHAWIHRHLSFPVMRGVADGFLGRRIHAMLLLL